MATAKLSGDKLKQLALRELGNRFMDIYFDAMKLLADNNADDKMIKQIRRQLDGVNTIIRKEYKKSIERQTL